MRSYHFSLGNSSEGPIGYCARVQANSKAEAVEKLQLFIDGIYEVIEERPADDIEYLGIYLNGDAISTNDIDKVGG